MDLVCAREPSLISRGLPLCRLHLGYCRSSMGRNNRSLLPNPGNGGLFNRWLDERFHWRHGVLGHWRWYQRADSAGRHVRTCADKPARQVRCCVDLHYHSLLPFRSVGSIDRFAFELALDWTVVRYLGFHWPCADSSLLSSATPSEQPGDDEEAGPRRN